MPPAFIGRQAGSTAGQTQAGNLHHSLRAYGASVALDLCEGGKGAFAGEGVVDDGLRVGATEFDAGGAEDFGGSGVWFVNVFRGNFCQLRAPAADVVTIGIELFALRGWIEDSEVRGRVSTAAGGPLPA